MNSIENTIRNKDITTLDPNEIQSLFTNPTTSNTIKQFIALYKQLPFKMYIEQNILPNKKSKAKKGSGDVLDVLNFQTEPEYSFLFQVVMIEDITKSTSSQVESLLEIITGEVQYADRVNKKDGPTKRKVKELSKVDEIENNGDGDTSVLLENDITNVSNSAKDLTLKITLQDKTGAYYYCYSNPDKGGIVPLVELVNFGCVPICKKILGIKVVLKNFTFNRGVIILQKSQQIVTLARTSIPSWNENFYSKMIHFWKNSLETRNSALSKTLDRKEAGEKRKYHESRA